MTVVVEVMRLHGNLDVSFRSETLGGIVFKSGARILSSLSEVNVETGCLFGESLTLQGLNVQIGEPISVEVCDGMQCPSDHSLLTERIEIIRLNRLGRRVLDRFCREEPLVILVVNVKLPVLPVDQVVTSVVIEVDTVDSALRPRIVPVAVRTRDAAQVCGPLDLDSETKGAICGLCEDPKSILIWHHDIRKAIAIHIVGNIDMGDFVTAWGDKAGRERKFSRGGTRPEIVPFESTCLIGEEMLVSSHSDHIDE